MFLLFVESLSDKKRFPVYISDKVSALENISVFTTKEDMPLKEVLKKIYEKKRRTMYERNQYRNGFERRQKIIER
ncbi:MAG: DUF5606 domain-containing protein [Candidatus Edwardsbacteria bacterium]